MNTLTKRVHRQGWPVYDDTNDLFTIFFNPKRSINGGTSYDFDVYCSFCNMLSIALGTPRTATCIGLDHYNCYHRRIDGKRDDDSCFPSLPEVARSQVMYPRVNAFLSQFDVDW